MKRAGSTCAASACAPASVSPATISASNRRGASTPHGLQFANQVQNEIEWWIFWGRVAGGLNRNQQTDVFQRLSPTLLPRAAKRPRVNPSLLREMWRTAASLELLPIQTKTQLGDELLARVEKGDFVDTGLWCLARLGARKLFYGPINQVLPPATAARWMEALIKIPKAEDTIASLARHTGDSTRDLPPPRSILCAERSPISTWKPSPRSTRRNGQSVRRRTPSRSSIS